MPQMATLNWLSLYFFFLFIFIIFNIMNYFSINYKNKQSQTTKKKFLINWKW